MVNQSIHIEQCQQKNDQQNFTVPRTRIIEEFGKLQLFRELEKVREDWRYLQSYRRSEVTMICSELLSRNKSHDLPNLLFVQQIMYIKVFLAVI